jgi:hypothetical protein
MSKTLNQAMGDFMDFMNNYTDPIQEASDNYAQAQEDINDSIIDKLMEEIDTVNLLPCDCDLDCHPNTDNLREWLSLYYELRHK